MTFSSKGIREGRRRHAFAVFSAGFLGAALAALLLRRTRRRAGRDVAVPESGLARDFVPYAHRGGAANVPENTLAAFGAGVSAGATGIEMDIHLTRDGYLVVIHDETVERTTNGCGAVSDMNLGELRGLDAGFRFIGGSDGSFPFRGCGLRIPTFREVLEEFGGVGINVEIKSGSPEAATAMLDELHRSGAAGRTIVASASHRRIRAFRREAARRGVRVRTSASLPEIALFALAARFGAEGIVPAPYVALQVPAEYRGIPVVTQRFVEAAHTRGIRVDVWTIDDEEEMRRLIELGVDGIMTDRPDVLSEVVAGL